jgi:quercetin dioxygenase-like cupin family protein
MKIINAIFMIPLTFLLSGGLTNSFGQEITLSNETINLNQHEVVLNKELGFSTSSMGKQLFQMEVTLVEIPSGGLLPPQKHMSDELIYIISGQGYTTMWLRNGETKEQYNWSEGDMLSPTLNAWHQHFNNSTDTPARYLIVSSAPLIYSMFHTRDFIDNNDYVFEDRWEKNVKQQPEYTPIGTGGAEIVRMRVGHHIANLHTREMRERREGVLGITIRPEGDMANSHIMEWEVREYQRPDSVSPQHRHPWEVVYYIMSGEGYAILQREGESKRKVNWKKGDIFFVEANEFHELRPLNNTKPRFLQMKASGIFNQVGNLLIEGGLRPEK